MGVKTWRLELLFQAESTRTPPWVLLTVSHSAVVRQKKRGMEKSVGLESRQIGEELLLLPGESLGTTKSFPFHFLWAFGMDGRIPRRPPRRLYTLRCCTIWNWNWTHYAICTTGLMLHTVPILDWMLLEKTRSEISRSQTRRLWWYWWWWERAGRNDITLSNPLFLLTFRPDPPSWIEEIIRGFGFGDNVAWGTLSSSFFRSQSHTRGSQPFTQTHLF